MILFLTFFLKFILESVILNQPFSVRYGVFFFTHTVAQTEWSASSSPTLALWPFQFPSLEELGVMLPVSHAGWADVFTGCGGYRE